MAIELKGIPLPVVETMKVTRGLYPFGPSEYVNVEPIDGHIRMAIIYGDATLVNDDINNNDNTSKNM